MQAILILGSGFAGAVAARQLAEKYNRKVLVVEKRSHIGGNMFEAEVENGIRVHKYGPHLFHTNSDMVFEYLKRFGLWKPYTHRVLGKIDGKLVPIPFNFKSMDMLFSIKPTNILKNRILEEYPNQEKISIMDLMQTEDSLISDFGKYVFEKVFVHYTAKQWQQPIEKVDVSVINRIPVVLSYDDRYFSDKHQYIPKDGYNEIFENLLNHPNIKVKLNFNSRKRLQIDYEEHRVYLDGTEWNGPIIYTGAVDELMNYRIGYLPYRSLDLVFEQCNADFYQPGAVVNYPNEEEFTRITEFKHITGQKLEGKTAILKEYPMNYDPYAKKGNTPYYPIINQKNLDKYHQYKELLKGFSNIYLCGRLAEYKYYNMDQVIERAILLADKLGE